METLKAAARLIASLTASIGVCCLLIAAIAGRNAVLIEHVALGRRIAARFAPNKLAMLISVAAIAIDAKILKKNMLAISLLATAHSFKRLHSAHRDTASHFERKSRLDTKDFRRRKTRANRMNYASVCTPSPSISACTSACRNNHRLRIARPQRVDIQTQCSIGLGTPCRRNRNLRPPQRRHFRIEHRQKRCSARSEDNNRHHA